MSKGLIFSISLLVILVTAVVVYFKEEAATKDKKSYKPGVSKEVDSAINQAQNLYYVRRNLGEDFSKSPCLSNDLIPGWVVDISYSPRQPVDDLPENQCSAYLEGRAKHFVELDPEGNLIRAR
jgi:hypothetical protein